MTVKALKTVRQNGGNYFIDMRLGEFRRVDTLESIDFAGKRGAKFCKDHGIFKCPRCGRYDRFSNSDGESKLCPHCEKIFWRQDYE